MGEPFIGEIRMFGGSFAPSGWAFCSGQLMPISENEALFTLIGTTYGGDGQTTFALPDLQGRIPVHQGTGPDGISYVIGEKAGVESVTLTVNQIPIHSHGPAQASSADGTQSSPANGVWAKSSIGAYAAPPATVSMNPQALTLSPAGGSQPHDNMMPFLVVSFIISLFGVFPTQN